MLFLGTHLFMLKKKTFLLFYCELQVRCRIILRDEAVSSAGSISMFELPPNELEKARIFLLNNVF